MSEAVTSPNAPRPADPLVREIADGLARIERNYEREGSGPGSRFEGRLLEDAQAEWVVRLLERTAQRSLYGIRPHVDQSPEELALKKAEAERLLREGPRW